MFDIATDTQRAAAIAGVSELWVNSAAAVLPRPRRLLVDAARADVAGDVVRRAGAGRLPQRRRLHRQLGQRALRAGGAGRRVARRRRPRLQVPIIIFCLDEATGPIN